MRLFQPPLMPFAPPPNRTPMLTQSRSACCSAVMAGGGSCGGWAYMPHLNNRRPAITKKTFDARYLGKQGILHERAAP